MINSKYFLKKDVRSFSFVILMFLLGLFICSHPAFASGGLETLDKANDAMETILTWLKRIVTTGSIIYVVYLVGMALAEKKSWSDVLWGFGYCAIAGGVVYGGSWATTLWD